MSVRKPCNHMLIHSLSSQSYTRVCTIYYVEVKHDRPSKYSVGCENSNKTNDDPVACYSPNTSVEQ